jgi:hypothetical protein
MSLSTCWKSASGRRESRFVITCHELGCGVHPRCDFLLECPPEECPPPCALAIFGALGIFIFGAE